MYTPNRRQLLRGVSLGAGAVLLNPIVHQLGVQAAGDAAALPKRFVFVLEGNGCQPGQVQPPEIKRQTSNGRATNDRMTRQPLAGKQLPRALEPMKPFQDRLTIVQGLSGHVCGGGHSNNFGALGVYNGKKGAAGETIDAALARALPAIFPFVGLGLAERAGRNVLYNCSATGPDKALPIQANPEQAYNMLFGSIAAGNGRKNFNAHSALLDFMTDDVKRLEKQVAGPEREKLHGYLESFESLRQRQSRLGEIESVLRRCAPTPGDKFKSAVETDILDSQFDLAAAALIAGLTNVVTLASGVGDANFGVTFRGLGIEIGKHGIGHGGSYNGMDAGTLSTNIRRFHFELIARLATKLQGVREGDGTMLDNTLIVYLSDGAESHHARCWEWPFVLVGNLGGKLKAGQYIDYPAYGKPGHRTIGSLYTTFLHAAGAPRDRFGLPDGDLGTIDAKGPLSELLA